MLCFIVPARKWHLDVLRGPVPITAAEVLALKSPASLPNQYVTLTASKIVHTDVRLVKTRYGRSETVREYVLVQVGDRWLVADVPPGFRGNRLTGYLAKWTASNDVDALQRLYQELPGRDRERRMPFELNAGDDQVMKSRAFLAVFGSLAGLGLVWAVYSLCRRVPVVTPPAASPATNAPVHWSWEKGR